MNKEDYDMLQTYISVIGVILAIGSLVSPILFGAILWKMSQMFVSKSDFESFKKDQELKRIEDKTETNSLKVEIKESLKTIEADMKEIFKKAQFKTS